MFILNARLDIIIEANQKSEHYSSRIEGITDDQMDIAMPMSKSVPVILHPGTKIRGRISANGVAWEFTSTFIDKKISPLPIWIIKIPDELTKIQLRSYVRIATNVPAQISILTDQGESPAIMLNTRDISGGGLMLISKQPMTVGTKLKFSLDLGIDDNPVASGVVIRVDKPSDLNLFWIAVKFTDITERNREKIIKYIFKKQTERRQKELI